MHTRIRPLLGLTASLLLLAGSSAAASDDGVATLGSPAPAASSAPGQVASDDPQQAFLDYAACMREHGVDMPDPEVIVGEDGSSTIAISFGASSIDGLSGPDDASAAADAACSHLLGSVVADIDPELEAEMLEQQLAVARCMREHGVDMPDPEVRPDGGTTVRLGGSLEVDTETFEAALEACNALGGGFGFSVGPAEGP